MKKSFLTVVVFLGLFITSGCTEENNYYQIEKPDPILVHEEVCACVYFNTQAQWASIVASLTLDSKDKTLDEWNLMEWKVVSYQISYTKNGIYGYLDPDSALFRDANVSSYSNINGALSVRRIFTYINQNLYSNVLYDQFGNPATISEIKIVFAYKLSGDTEWRFTLPLPIINPQNCDFYYTHNKNQNYVK